MARDDRYQHQRWWVKAWRQLRHRPKYWWRCGRYTLRYYLGMMKDERPLPPKIARSIFRGTLDCEMRHYYSWEELFND